MSFFVNVLFAVAVSVAFVPGSAVAQSVRDLFPNSTVLAPPATPTKLPEFEFANLTGNGTLKSSDMKGKVVIIRYWATW